MCSSYGESIMVDYNFLFDKQQYDIASAGIGLTTAWFPSSSILTLGTSAYQNFSMYLYTPFSTIKPYMKKLTENFLWKFYFRNSVSSGSGVLSLVSLNLCFDVDVAANYNNNFIDRLYDNNVLRYSYSDKINITQSLSFNASQTTKFSLQNLIGKCAFLVFMLRSSVSSTNQGYNNYQALGATNSATLANVQIQNASSYDILNYGNGLSLLDLNEIASMYCDNTLFLAQNIYFIPFCENIKNAYAGVQSGGYWYFDGTNYQLAILPDATFRSGTYQLDVFAYVFKSACIDSGAIKVYSN